ncbi:hypothetical protein HDV06_005230 [Boothiomyces sp. JEL0866]|nr:hypothetical protein HDV06_005230 [Boothiomyces sp. JEL0866]
MKGRFLFLDGIRGLAALVVMFQHAEYAIPQNAVDTFFVLSSFLLTVNFYKKSLNLINSGTKKQWVTFLADYFIRRFLRVYPAFLACALLIYLTPEKDQSKSWFLHSYPMNLFKILTFQERPHILWTLPVELQYYFIIPIYSVIVLIAKKRWYIPVLFVLLLSIYGDYGLLRQSGMYLKAHIFTFLNGSTCAFIYVQLSNSSYLEIAKNNNLIGFMLEKLSVGNALLILSLAYKRLFVKWIIRIEMPYYGYPYTSLFMGILLIKECLIPGSISRFFEWNFLTFTGQISFSLYLTHSWVVYLWNSQENFVDHFYFMLFVSLSVAYVFYSVVEYPAMQFTNWVTKRVKQWGEDRYLPLKSSE